MAPDNKTADGMPYGQDITETTPLLAAPEVSVQTQIRNGELIDRSQDDGRDDAPMPVGQIILLCYASLVDPIAYFAIFPFINEMIFRTGDLDESDVGFWSGLIESLFSVVQMMLMIVYGRLADRIGRKPVLVFSLAGISVATALFGLGRTLWQMIILRCMAGLFAGSVVTIRTMIGENCSTSAPRAYSWYMFTRNMGIFIGPLIGGGLANPAEQYPNVFGHIAFFKDYPYALATFVAGVACSTATLAALFGLDETLQRKPVTADSSKPAQPPTIWQVFNSPGVPIVIFIFGHTMLLAYSYTAISPVFLYTPIDIGGLGFSDQYIAGFFAVAGVSQALWMLLAFPFLQKRLGTGRLLRICAVIYPLELAMFPFLNELLRRNLTTAFWAIGAPGLVIGSGISMAFACVQLCLNDISPSPSVLATVNALALTVNSAVRASAPIAFTSLYAVGVKLQWADGHLAWFVLVSIASGLSLAVHFLPEAAEGRPQGLGKRRAEEGRGGTRMNGSS